MRKYIAFLIVIVMTMVVSGCANADNTGTNSKDSSSYISEEINNHGKSDYEMKEIDNRYYMIFDGEFASAYNSQMSATIDFESIEHMKDSVLNHKLTEGQKRTIATVFPKDKNGIRICDFDKLYDAVVPGSLNVQNVLWSGESYSFSVVSFDEQVSGHITYLPEEQYNILYDSDYDDFFNNDAIFISNREWISDRNADVIYYSTQTADLKRVSYTIETETRILLVEETYRLNALDASLSTSNEIPLLIKLYGKENGAHYKVLLYSFNQRPTVEWLSEFGLKAF